jgi:hypothetical protein
MRVWTRSLPRAGVPRREDLGLTRARPPRTGRAPYSTRRVAFRARLRRPRRSAARRSRTLRSPRLYDAGLPARYRDRSCTRRPRGATTDARASASRMSRWAFAWPLPAELLGGALPAARRRRVRADGRALCRRTVTVVEALVHRRVAVVPRDTGAAHGSCGRGRAVPSRAAVGVDPAVARDARVALVGGVGRPVAGAGLAGRASCIVRACVVGAHTAGSDSAARLDAATVTARRALRIGVASARRATAAGTIAGCCGRGALAVVGPVIRGHAPGVDTPARRSTAGASTRSAARSAARSARATTRRAARARRAPAVAAGGHPESLPSACPQCSYRDQCS